jgi:hypothetical protein
MEMNDVTVLIRMFEFLNMYKMSTKVVINIIQVFLVFIKTLKQVGRKSLLLYCQPPHKVYSCMHLGLQNVSFTASNMFMSHNLVIIHQWATPNVSILVFTIVENLNTSQIQLGNNL